MDFTNGEFSDNLGRASNLIAASKQLAGTAADPVPLAQDVLRAAVVFLHASLEEVIRNLYVRRLPNVAPEKLDEIPLAGTPGLRRPTKLLLGALVQFRGEFVENVIKKSIDAYVDTFNLNNVNELAHCLELAEIEVDPLRSHFPALNELMLRRHQIVHQMDRTNELDPLTAPLSSLDVQTVERWELALESFVQDLFAVYTT
jgi:hypothetical protein